MHFGMYVPKVTQSMCSLLTEKVSFSISANVYVSLPLGFDGKLAIWAPAGTIELSEPLKRSSTIIPSTTNNAYITVYRIVAEGSTASAEHSQIQQATTMDLCQLNTSKGRVRVDYARAPRDADGCILM